MITSTNGSMELLISEPHFLPSLKKSHHYYHESSMNTSKELQKCSNLKSKTCDVKLRNPSSTSKINSLTINESHPVMTIDKTTSNRLSPIYDEDMKNFPCTIPLDNPNKLNHRSATLLSSSHQATLYAHRHFHIYDWTRISFYDNVPAPIGYLSEPLIIEDRSPTSTSSNDDKHSSLDQKDSLLEKQFDSIVLSNNIKQQSIGYASSSSSSTSPSSSLLSLNSNLTNRFPTTRKIRVKWHSFTKTHRPSFNSSKYHLGQMSVGQLLALRRAALIQIQELFGTTRILSNNKSTLINRTRTTSTTTTTTTRQRFFATAFSAVPKLIIRKHQQRKEIHHEIKRTVFGVSLLSMTQRTGHPVPITIISAMKYLRRIAIDSVGIFRKPGVSHRIKRLHDLIESDFEFHQFDDFSPYDVSDVLKQYFRFLPECLFTNKLSPLFLQINDNFSNEQCLIALQYAILLLPDENRLVLHLLLSFLNDISKHSKTNQMSSINLATCFAPTLFSFRNYNKISTNGMPDLREIQEQRKAMDILSYMIDNVRYLFLVPYQLHQTCQFSYIEIGEPCTLEELSRRISEPQLLSSSENLSLNTNNNNSNTIKIKSTNRSYQNFIDRCIIEVIRESCSIKGKGWTSFGKINQLELAFKKLDDGHPLGLWKCSIEIEAPPIEILHRLLYERNLWDDDFQSGNIIEILNHNTHVYQYTINSMAPLASRYFCELRSWKTDIQLNTNKISMSSANMISTQREACVLICTSIEHPKGHCPPTLVRAVTLASRYLIQSNGCGKSKITHLSRVDLMGRSHEWYSKVYGSILTRSMSKLRDSFVHLTNTGPETKV